MREKQSRRTFLEVGLGCAAPILLGTPLLEAAGRRLAAGQAAGGAGDEVLGFVRGEVVRIYHRSRLAVEATGRVPADQVRALSAQVGLLDAYIASRAEDRRFDEQLRQCLRRDGRDATAQRLGEAYRSVQERLGAEDGVMLPPEPDLARTSAALQMLEKRGLRRTLQAVRQYAEQEARRGERPGVHPAAIPVAARQKPGDDFGGYPVPPDGGPWTCNDATVLLDAFGIALAFAALCGGEAFALVMAPVYAIMILVKDIACMA